MGYIECTQCIFVIVYISLLSSLTLGLVPFFGSLLPFVRSLRFQIWCVCMYVCAHSCTGQRIPFVLLVVVFHTAQPINGIASKWNETTKSLRSYRIYIFDSHVAFVCTRVHNHTRTHTTAFISAEHNWTELNRSMPLHASPGRKCEKRSACVFDMASVTYGCGGEFSLNVLKRANDFAKRASASANTRARICRMAA